MGIIVYQHQKGHRLPTFSLQKDYEGGKWQLEAFKRPAGHMVYFLENLSRNSTFYSIENDYIPHL